MPIFTEEMRKKALAGIDDVLGQAQEHLRVRERDRNSRGSSPTLFLNDSSTDIGASRLVMLIKSVINRWSGNGSLYSVSWDEQIGQFGKADSGKIWPAIGILQALRYDIEKYGLQTFEQLVHAEVFSDFLSMASHLYENGYNLPAAVLAGSTLEAHLRAMCIARNIPTTKPDKNGDQQPLKVGEMNADLKKAGAYGVPEVQNVTARYAVRNSAAHQDPSVDLTRAMVGDMISGVRRFITEHSA